MKKLGGLVLLAVGILWLLVGGGGWALLPMVSGLLLTWSGESPRT